MYELEFISDLHVQLDQFVANCRGCQYSQIGEEESNVNGWRVVYKGMHFGHVVQVFAGVLQLRGYIYKQSFTWKYSLTHLILIG